MHLVPTNVLPVPPKNSSRKPAVTQHQYSSVPPLAHASPNRSNEMNYISLELNAPNTNQISPTRTTKTEYTQIIPSQQFVSNIATPKQQYNPINLQSHTPEKSRSYDRCDFNSFDKTNLKNIDLSTKFDGWSHMNRLQEQSENIDGLQSKSSSAQNAPHRNQMFYDRSNEEVGILKQLSPKSNKVNGTFQRLSLENYDYLMGNPQQDMVNNLDSEGAHGVHTNCQDQNAIETFGIANRIKQMQDLGVPPEEILEIDRRITQQERDEV